MEIKCFAADHNFYWTKFVTRSFNVKFLIRKYYIDLISCFTLVYKFSLAFHVQLLFTEKSTISPKYPQIKYIRAQLISIKYIILVLY